MSIREDYTGEFDDDEINDSLQKASDALETVYVLSDIAKDTNNDYTVTEEKTANLAIESFYQKHPEFVVANEEIDDGTPTKTTGEKIKKTIDYLFSIARNILTFFMDYIKNNKRKASGFISVTKDLIGRSDHLSSNPGLKVDRRSIIATLHIDGSQPSNILNMYAKITKASTDQRKHIGLPEIGAASIGARRGNLDQTKEAVSGLRNIYESGYKASMEYLDNPNRSFAFNGSRDDCDHYVSESYFGAMHVAGWISKEVKQDGSFLIDSFIKTNPEIPLRTNSFEALSPEEVREICRAVHKFSQSVISNSHDETGLARLLREVTFIAGNRPDLTTVLALRSIASVSKGPFLTYLKLAMNVSKQLLNYCSESIAINEKFSKGEEYA